MAPDHIAFSLEHKDGDRFFERIHAVVLFVGLLREQHEIAHAYAVPVLKDLVIPVLDVVVDAVEDAARVAARRSHPEDVVISPLDIQIVLVIHQKVHDPVRVLAAVKDIPENVELVDRKPLGQSTERDNELVRAVGIDDRFEDLLVIQRLIVVLVLLRVHQLIDDESEFIRHRFTDFGPCIFGREEPCQKDQPVQDLQIPGPRDRSALLHSLELLDGIIDQRAEFRPLLLRHGIPEDQLDFFADHARAVVHDMLEGLILPVDITQEVFCSFRQVQDRLEIDDLRERRSAVRKFPGKKMQYFNVFGYHWCFSSYCCITVKSHNILIIV